MKLLTLSLLALSSLAASAFADVATDAEFAGDLMAKYVLQHPNANLKTAEQMAKEAKVERLVDELQAAIDDAGLEDRPGPDGNGL